MFTKSNFDRHAKLSYLLKYFFFLQHVAHPSCIEMPPRMAIRVQDYDWQCTECKHCSKCRQMQHEDKMLFCDQCDRGYHIYCIGLKGVPEGESLKIFCLCVKAV